MSVNSFIKVCDVPRLPWSEHGSFYWGNKCPFSPFPADEADCHLEEHFYRNLSNRYWQNYWEILDALKILYEQNCSCLAFVEHLRPSIQGRTVLFSSFTVQPRHLRKNTLGRWHDQVLWCTGTGWKKAVCIGNQVRVSCLCPPALSEMACSLISYRKDFTE